MKVEGLLTKVLSSIGRNSRRQVFLSMASAGTTGFLFSLQANQLEGSFFLNVDVSSGSLLVLPLRVLTIFFQSLSPLVQIGLLPPAVQNIPLC